MNVENKINNLPKELKLTIYSYFVWTPKNKNDLKNAINEWCDDKKEAIQKRIEVYFESTIPLISYYEATNILVQIDGSNSIDVVTNQLKNILSN